VTERLRASKTITGDDSAAIVRPGLTISAVELLERRKG
jgi:hypothetical protein